MIAAVRLTYILCELVENIAIEAYFETLLPGINLLDQGSTLNKSSSETCQDLLQTSLKLEDPGTIDTSSQE